MCICSEKNRFSESPIPITRLHTLKSEEEDEEEDEEEGEEEGLGGLIPTEKSPPRSCHPPNPHACACGGLYVRTWHPDSGHQRRKGAAMVHL
jgi:hypothetical protein